MGNPKAVMLSHDNLIIDARTIVKAEELETEAKESIVSFLPLSHVAAQVKYIHIIVTLKRKSCNTLRFLLIAR